MTMPKSSETRSESFLFRRLNQDVLIGTASYRYAGWIGQDCEERIAHGAWDRGHRAKSKGHSVIAKGQDL